MDNASNMNKLLIFGSSIVAAMASEAGPTAERKLAAFNGGNYDAATGTYGTDACRFRPTSELFAHTWEKTAMSANGAINGNTDAFNINADDTLTEGATANTNIIGQVSAAAWHEDVKLARFTVDIKLTNYDALATATATKNYKYFDFSGSAWGNTALDAAGEQNMVNVCVCKPRLNSNTGAQESTCVADSQGVDGVCEDGDTIVNVLPASSNGQAGPEKTIDFGLRKVLGVASLCGVSGDKHNGHDGGSDDIFVWASLTATDQLKFQLTYDALSVAESSLASSAAAADAEASIQYTLVAHADEPATYDLLYIEQPDFQAASQLFSTSAQGGTDGESEYVVNYHDGHQASGGVTIATSDQTMTCTTSLAVHAESADHWQCFRSEAARALPDGVSPSAYADDTTGALAAVSAATASTNAAVSGGACGAKITVACTTGVTSVSGTDNRVCQVTQANLNGAANDQGSTDVNADYQDCVTSGWFTATPSYYQNEVTFDGSFEAVIVQAVRLRGNRAYPKGADSGAYAAAQTTFGTAATSTWNCDDANGDCSAEDPFVVLSSDKVTLSYAYDATGLGPFATDGTTSASNHLGYCVGGTVTNPASASASCSRSATTSITQSVTSGGTNAVAGDGALTYTSGWEDLIAPPAGFPETYVFGLASFSFDTTNDGADDTQVIRRPDDGDSQGAHASNNGNRPARLLRSTPTKIEKTFIVNAMQNVYQK